MGSDSLALLSSPACLNQCLMLFTTSLAQWGCLHCVPLQGNVLPPFAAGCVHVLRQYRRSVCSFSRLWASHPGALSCWVELRQRFSMVLLTSNSPLPLLVSTHCYKARVVAYGFPPSCQSDLCAHQVVRPGWAVQAISFVLPMPPTWPRFGSTC